ncbi:MAG: 2-isopropylmalate synthase [Cellvibrionales bacterium]|nr:2-isopropylmalate synthase [Cellvibrionales bacterium]
MFDHRKYTPFQPPHKPDRRWPDRRIEKAPIWCSVDLRDGNQALIDPMTPAQKMQMFELLVDLGFKEIEIGFPAASQTDFDFARQLIEQDRIPADVCVQVLTQARSALIERSFAALEGAHSAIVHLYNSTSPTQREKVFGASRAQIKQIAVDGAQRVAECAERRPQTAWRLQYSPESFTATELEFSLEVCNAVSVVWQPSPANPAIINLPATVEVATPNVYADQIEWMSDHLDHRDCLILSLHTHNDRGCGVAAAELGLLAGADRLEGTLLGNGERTGNMDLVTAAMNLYSQGIDPQLNLAAMDRIISTVESCTRIATHPRHAYAGELVFTAFSGSHQDAIRKCMAAQRDDAPWDVAYLPIDPRDLGRTYQEVIRINSQSGKGGVAWVLEQEYQIKMPRWMQIDFSGIVQREAERTDAEVPPETIWALFQATYMSQNPALALRDYELKRRNGRDQIRATLTQNGTAHTIAGSGRGAMDAFCNALATHRGHGISVIDYSEHTTGQSAKAEALAYVQLGIDGQRACGAARSEDLVGASLQAVLNALANQAQEQAAAA